MSWQLAAVIVIELLAVLWLARKLWPRARAPRVLTKPDVPVQSLLQKSLLRKKQDQGS
ncbi:MAG: hypothetical protein IT378_27490 [Sandaracinaceae bacterium]|nr:hypothetical protein [Sandaracinaceae bacterium]